MILFYDVMDSRKKVVSALISLSLLFSCTNEEVEQPGSTVPEGESIGLSLQLDDGLLKTRSGLTSSQETAVNSIFVLVFNKNGLKVSQNYFSSNITASLKSIATRSGSNMSIYVVTNMSTQNTGLTYPATVFDYVNTVAELNAVTISNLAADLNVNLDLVAYGKVTGLTLSPSVTNNVTVKLNYVVSRVTLYVVTNLKNAADAYALTDWSVLNYPTKSYLIGQSTDAVTPGSTSDYSNSATTKMWNDTTIMIQGVSTPAKYAFMYTFENRRGMRTGDISGTNQLDKAKYAPTSASAIQFRGYYKSTATSTVTGLITTVYLGADSYGDYNVDRGNDYSYIATVQGINDISVDSRVTGSNSSFQVNVFNTTLDCHPDWRPLQLSSWGGTASISILQNSTDVSPAPSGYWLQVSAKNLNQFVNNGSGVYVRPVYSPTTDMLSQISGITFTNTTAITSQMFYLYAAENLSAIPRTAYVQIAESGTQSITLAITQQGYQTMGTVGMRPHTTAGAVTMSGDYSIVVENTEEPSLILTPGVAAGTESTTVMQWGYNLTSTEPTASISQSYYGRNGLLNTQKLVYGTTSGLSSVLLPAFGRNSASSASSASATISEQYKDPIFNTNAARYCFEKNRDLDGDGLVSNPNTQGVNEINWYMPAADELYQLYVGQQALANPLFTSGQTYASSTELYGSNNTILGMYVQIGVSGGLGKSGGLNVRCIRQLPNPNSATRPTSPYVENHTAVINNQQFNSAALQTSHMGYPAPIHTYASAANTTLSPRFQVSKTQCLLYGTTGASAMTWAQANGWTTASDINSGGTPILASPATGCNAYSETGIPAGQWRVPTLKEFYIIQALRPELLLYTATSGFTDLAVTQQWCSTTYNNNSGFFIGLYNNYIGVSANGVGKYVRCVHDL